MKNINVSLKMITCFAILTVLMLCIGASGLIGMHELNKQANAMHEEIFMAIDYIGLIRENIQEQRVLVQELSLLTNDSDAAARVVKAIDKNKEEMKQYLANYETEILLRQDAVNQEITSKENAESYETFSSIYHTYFETVLTRLARYYTNITDEEIEAFIASVKVAEMEQAINNGYAFYSNLLESNMRKMDTLYASLRAIILAATAITFVVAAIFAVYLPVSVARPLRRMVKVADAVSVGNMEIDAGCENRHDEVGKLASAFERMKTEINKQIAVVEALAQADLTVEPVLRGEHDTLGKALVKLTQNLDQIITDVAGASDNVAMEARDVATQSQELAQGTTEQAASVEELSSAFFEISMNTKENSSLAGKTADLTDDVRKMALEGETLMAQLTQAVKDTDTASKNIDKIIRAIEEISFQTNILALNAAVEAAHAGQNGSGFAVVAAEVRSLASKSAASSKETSELIANTLEKVQFGAELAAKTSSSFKQIVEGIMESTKLVTNIAKSSEEQAIAIDQINTGITQVAQVIHINSSAAEKCAAAAEKMSHQAKRMEDSIRMFKTKTELRERSVERPARSEIVLNATPPAMPEKIDLSPAIPTDDFGKY